MSNQIDLIVSKQAQEQLDKLYNSLSKTHDMIIRINQNQITFNNSGAPKGIADLNVRIKDSIRLTGELSEAEQKLLTNTAKLERLKQAQINTSIRQNALARSQANEADRQAKANERLSSAYQQLSRQQAESARRVQDIIARGRTATQTQREYNRELSNAQDEFNSLNRRVLQADTAVGRFNRNVGNYPRQAFTGIGNILGAFGTVGGMSLLADMSKDIFKTTKEIQSLDLALKQVVETDAKFAESQAFLRDVSEKYGIEINGLTKQFTQFYVSAKDKISGKEIQQIFESVAKSAGFMGLSVDAQNRAFTALNQMMSKGTVSAEELKGQLGEALPGAFGIMAKSMGVTEQQLGKLMQDGKVLASDVLPKFAKELEKAYGIENKNRVESLSASQTRLSNTWTEFVRTLNESPTGGITKFFTSIINGANTALNALVSLNESSKQIRERFKLQSSSGTSDFLGNVKDIKQREELAKLTREDALKWIDIYNKKLTEAKENYKKYNEVSLANFSIENTRKRKQASDDIQRYNISLGTQKGRLLSANKVLLELTEKENKSIDYNTLATKKNTKAKKENVKEQKKINEYTEDWYLSEISRLEKIRNATADTTAEYKSYNTQLEALHYGLKLLRGDFNFEGEGLKLDLDKLGLTADAFEKFRKGGKEAVTELNSYLKGFYDQFGSESGMPTLFKVLNNEIDGFKDNWKVQAVAIMEIGQELTNVLTSQSKARFDAEYSRLEQQKNISLKFAGDNADAKTEIERQYEERRKVIQRRQAESEKRLAMFNIAINTAQAVMATLGKTGFAGIPLSVIIGAIGAAQLAMVASQEIPAFAEGGVHNGGLMLINDAKGSNYEETIVTPDGKAKKYKGRNVLVNAEKGTQIYTPKQWEKTKKEETPKFVNNHQEIEININENGFRKMISSNFKKREILNSRLTTKGRIV